MLSLYDLVQKSFAAERNADAMERAFGLTKSQANQVLMALIPAFSLGLQRLSRDPKSLMSLLELIHAFPSQAAPNPFGRPLDSDAMQAAQRSLTLLFGASSAHEAIAEQASKLAGIPGDRVLQMMPATVSAIMSGLQQDAPIKQGPVPDLLAAFVDGFERGRPEPDTAPDFSPQAAAEMLDSFFTGFRRGRVEPAPQADAAAETPASMFGRMFEAGEQIQSSHMDAMRAAFDRIYEKQA